ncbi:MAG TPA: polysaccharide deacetylase family protein [Saprospiraceae bacterium]|nr:polysaccharide deacetylase family protein [Saprospiraceae bacterium]
MYLIRTPAIVQHLFPSFIWRNETLDNQLYLTFDDGPVPQVTPWVLDQLKEYEAHATFFCVGENVQKYPEIYHRIQYEGHAVGNHTHNHISGWAHDPKAYMDNVSTCSELVESNLFRPPYGRLGRRQARSLMGHQYRIVMWDVLSGDFDRDLDPEQCYHNVIDNARPGSIIVFHDSIKAELNLRWALPKVLEFYTQKGYHFNSLHAQYVEQRLRKTA